MDTSILLPALFLLTALLNLPLGYLRQDYAPFTFGWFFYTHLSIPAIIYLITKSGLAPEFFHLTLAGAVAGQYLGGRIARRRGMPMAGRSMKADDHGT